MNESTVIQLVVQTGAIGLCALMMLYVARKMDRLADRIGELVEEVRLMLDRDKRFRGSQ